MSNKKRHRPSHTAIAVRYNIRKALVQHIRSHASYYAPAMAPVVCFLLAHGITVPALVLAKTGVISGNQAVYTSVVTWAVYGFLPLFFCSYIPFYLVARPLATQLEQRYDSWSGMIRDALSGTGYGVVIGIGLVLLLQPDSRLGELSLLFFGTTVGLLNWLFYRKLAGVAP